MMKKISVRLCLIMLMIIIPVQSVSAYEDWVKQYLDPADHKIEMGDETGYANCYAAYLDVVEKCIEQYGDTDYADGPSSGTQITTGLSFLKLVDFNGDGTEELVLVFNSRPKEDSGRYTTWDYVFNVWSFDEEQAVLLQDGTGLFGTNGGIQTVCFVKNQYGSFLRRGAADSFQYYFYYGYKKDNDFGLAKVLAWEELYDEAAGDMRREYTVDDELVSEEKYNAEMETWNGNSSDSEAYLLTPWNTEEKEKTKAVIDETMRLLQQHSRDKEEPEEKEEPKEKEEPQEKEEPREKEESKDKEKTKENSVPEWLLHIGEKR